LTELDRELANVPAPTRMPAATKRRMSWRLPALAIAVAIAVLVIVRLRGHDEPAQVAGFRVDAPATSYAVNDDTIEVNAPRLELDVPGFGHIAADEGAQIARVDGGIRVVRGHVDVAVIHRPAGAAPALVRVSHGTIAVLGTRFTIEQAAQGGRVVLHEGRIRFDAGDRSVTLEAGGSLAWPLEQIATREPAPQPVQTSPPPPQPARAKTAAPNPIAEEPVAPEPAPQPETIDVDRVLSDLGNLRARRRFSEAVALLERTLSTPLPAATHERLGYELGAILTYQLADRARACRHWQAYRAQFPQGRYTDEVAAAVRRLSCEETP
jgi:transmembrane sensor